MTLNQIRETDHKDIKQRLNNYFKRNKNLNFVHFFKGLDENGNLVFTVWIKDLRDSLCHSFKYIVKKENIKKLLSDLENFVKKVYNALLKSFRSCEVYLKEKRNV